MEHARYSNDVQFLIAIVIIWESVFLCIVVMKIKIENFLFFSNYLEHDNFSPFWTPLKLSYAYLNLEWMFFSIDFSKMCIILPMRYMTAKYLQ